MPSRFFRIPDHAETRAMLVDAVPDSWSGLGWVDGWLSAPGAQIAYGQAVKDTGIVFERFHVHPIIRGDWARREAPPVSPDLFGILAEHKLPGFISFQEAGYACREVTLPLAKRFAAHYLRLGYRGWLTFFSRCLNNKKYDNPERVSFRFVPWEGAREEGEAGSQAPRVRLEWYPPNGNLDALTPVLQVCALMNLKEYQPQSVAA